VVTHLLVGVIACVRAHAACTCIPGPRLTSHADAAAQLSPFAAVFEGTVVSTSYVEDSVVAVAADDSTRTPRAFRWTDLEITLTVGRHWKGELRDIVTLRTPASTTMCGAEFTEGRTYLVFAQSSDYTGLGAARPARVNEVVYTTKCSPTTRGRDARRTAALLGRPLPITQSPGRAVTPKA